MIILIILALAILCIDSFLAMFWCDKLGKRIKELEYKIECTQYQIDDILCDINIVNRNTLNTYGMLSEMKQNKNL